MLRTFGPMTLLQRRKSGCLLENDDDYNIQIITIIVFIKNKS